ncbi:adenosylcobinamide-GDP ribazoletransferase [Ottowia sp.]|uniref:adenosylcobinamide-GDP ribazoletransferase n=1 Tax=Ottowia sp. TaxID=1898956 RepID=UPI002C7E5501|nr:adenosylcobinamide-GDP ribazoletransferase [Ottowia sp.]HRN74312.1 adenosylcobinamide-GDP ribazoletransferase [Ottowia sp.]HRQ01328.1 adenosylcobinamide-GDP ribazoletransferase [Ottowia sp.]
MNALRHFLLALQFFTRIPVTGRLAAWVGYSPEMLRASARHFPGVGWVVGAVAAGVLGLALTVLPAGASGALVAALLSTIASVWLTGAFHEDGLADTADGLGGGLTRERALAIMKDSRIGSYGTVALLLALLLKLALIALLAGRGTGSAMAALLGAHALSRLAPLLVMRALPYVGEADGSKSKPLADAISAAGVAVGVLWALPALALFGFAGGAVAVPICLLLWLLALAAMLRLLRRRLQGFTGDTLGATQQVCELALLLGLAAA